MNCQNKQHEKIFSRQPCQSTGRNGTTSTHITSSFSSFSTSLGPYVGGKWAEGLAWVTAWFLDSQVTGGNITWAQEALPRADLTQPRVEGRGSPRASHRPAGGARPPWPARLRLGILWCLVCGDPRKWREKSEFGAGGGVGAPWKPH